MHRIGYQELKDTTTSSTRQVLPRHVYVRAVDWFQGCLVLYHLAGWLIHYGTQLTARWHQLTAIWHQSYQFNEAWWHWVQPTRQLIPQGGVLPYMQVLYLCKWCWTSGFTRRIISLNSHIGWCCSYFLYSIIISK